MKALAFALCLLAAPAWAADIPPSLVARLSAWVADAAHYKDAAPPLIVHMTHRAMDAAYGGENVEALYMNGVVYLAPDFDPGKLRDQSILVHELTHHLQFTNGVRYVCISESEAEAYAVQKQWMALHGLDLYREFDIDPFTIAVISQCPQM